MRLLRPFGTRNDGRRIAALLALAVGFPPVYAEEAPLALPELLAEVQRVNPDLLAARKRWEAAQAKIPLAKGLPPPRIGIEFEEIPRGSVKLDEANLMFQFLQSLPFPGKLSLRKEVAVKEAQVAAAMFKQTQWELASDLKKVYYELFLLDRQLEIERSQAAWLAQAFGSAQARYATGAAPQAEALNAQAELLSARNQIAVLQSRRKAFEAHLNHLLSRSSEASLGSPGPLALLEVPDSAQALEARAQEKQPDLLIFKFSAEKAESDWKLKKRELLPDLETMFELRDPKKGPLGPWDLTLALVLPFWFWTKQTYGVKVALADKESASAAYQAMKNEITRRIHENFHEAQAAYGTALLCREQLIPLSRQAVSSALAAYQGGRGSFLELLEALRRLKDQERVYYEHLVMLEQRMVLLEQAVGAPLREEHSIRGSTGSPRTDSESTVHPELVEG